MKDGHVYRTASDEFIVVPGEFTEADHVYMGPFVQGCTLDEMIQWLTSAIEKFEELKLKERK